jgi:hypothetical protein
MFNNIKEKIVRYVEVNIKLFKLELIARTSSLISYLMFALILLIILCCIFLFFGFGLTEVFVDAGMTHAAAFFLTTGIYCGILALLILLRKYITGFFINPFVSILTDDDKDDDDDDDKKDNGKKQPQ